MAKALPFEKFSGERGIEWILGGGGGGVYFLNNLKKGFGHPFGGGRLFTGGEVERDIQEKKDVVKTEWGGSPTFGSWNFAQKKKQNLERSLQVQRTGFI